MLLLDALRRIIPLYPNIHRASQTTLSILALRFLSGNGPSPSSQVLLQSASKLYAVLHITGGKVGAATLWRKSVDETLAYGWNALLSLRTTFPGDGIYMSHLLFRRLRQTLLGHRNQQPFPIEEPLTAVHVNFERLRCAVIILCDLLKCVSRCLYGCHSYILHRSITHRPVQLPIGSILGFATALMSCLPNEKVCKKFYPGRSIKPSVIRFLVI